jgi:hypothetical protein
MSLGSKPSVTLSPARALANDHLARDQVHPWAAHKAGDEQISRLVIEFHRRAYWRTRPASSTTILSASVMASSEVDAVDDRDLVEALDDPL